MTTFQDCSVGIAKESTYGTAVTVTRWFEFLTESLDYAKNVVQGQGLRVGSTVPRSGRRVVPTSDGGGDVKLELTSKGLGLLWEQCMGSGASTVVPATSTYQQVFTFADVMPAATWQKGLPRTDGTVDAYTFKGGVVESFEVTFGQGVAEVAVTVDAREVVTDVAYASPSYVSDPNLFHFANGSVSTGTLTEPTATALASSVTALGNVRSGTIKVTHGLGSERYNYGGGGLKSKPNVGKREISGTLTVEYDSTTFRDAVLNDTGMVLLVEFTGGALDSGDETLQFVLPEIRLDGKLPAANEGELITIDLEFQAFDDLTASEPMWVVARTADTAL